MKANKAVSYSYDDFDSSQELMSEQIKSGFAMEQLIGLFEEEIHSSVKYDSFEYVHTQRAIHIRHGSPKVHKCQYKITLAEKDLGKITITRKDPFEENEMVIVERALGALTLQLNNQQ